MAVTSTMLPLGTKAPVFALPSIDAGTVSMTDFEGARALLVMFLCNHCPYVKHVEDELARMCADHTAAGLAAVGICSNDADNYPDDGRDGLADQASRAHFTFPYLIDESQDVAKAYGAVCTPDFFLFDADRKLVYRGQMDSTRPRSGDVATGQDLRRAIEAVLAGEPVAGDQQPSVGCSIKWKPGNELRS